MTLSSINIIWNIQAGILVQDCGMANSIECLRKVKCQNNNVWIGFEEAGSAFQNVDECNRSGSGRLESELITEGHTNTHTNNA